MYRAVVRNAIADSEVQPYREVEVRFLLPDSEHDNKENQLNAEAEALENAEAEEQRAQLRALAPLLLLTTAQAQAADIITQARNEAETLQQEAYSQGIELGREEGREEQTQNLLATLTAFTKAKQGLLNLEEQLVSHFASEIVRLALAISEKIVKAKVAEDPQVTAAVLGQARAEVPHARHVSIWLHPADYEVLQELRPELVQTKEEKNRTISIFTSEEIGRGGCRVETELGVVDATIPVQLEEIGSRLLDEAGS